MKYRIKKKSTKYKDRITTYFYIQRKYKLLLIFNLWVEADHYSYDTQKEAEDEIKFKCECDAIQIPKGKIVKYMNCNDK